MDELQKQRVLWAVIAFNITIIAYQLIFNSGLFNNPFTLMKLLLGLLLAAVVGGVAYVAAMFLQK